MAVIITNEKFMCRTWRQTLSLLVVIMISGCASVSVPGDAVYVTIDLQVDPARTEKFLAVMAEAAPDTRAFDGCQLFDIYVDQDKPGHVLFYEVWDSKTQQQAYLQWRQETGFLDKIGPFLTTSLGLAYFSKEPE
jgi:quinol monooxygenase YgiN